MIPNGNYTNSYGHRKPLSEVNSAAWQLEGNNPEWLESFKADAEDKRRRLKIAI